QISNNDREVPIDYAMDEVVQYISPPFRSGSSIRFAAQKFQAVVGRIAVRDGQAAVPIEFYEITLTVDGQPRLFQTTREGEFYLESVKAGTYEASFAYHDVPCLFPLTIPESPDVIIDLGELVCEPGP
ncbi:MAG: hypothetical protein AB1515_09050, partial [Nitrospirota bacterium]